MSAVSAALVYGPGFVGSKCRVNALNSRIRNEQCNSDSTTYSSFLSLSLSIPTPDNGKHRYYSVRGVFVDLAKNLRFG